MFLSDDLHGRDLTEGQFIVYCLSFSDSLTQTHRHKHISPLTPVLVRHIMDE